LKGGHSGDDINKGLGNAVKLLNRFLWNGSEKFFMRVSSIDAGNLRNAIAREGFAVVSVETGKQEEFRKYTKQYESEIRNELKTKEPNLRFTAEPCDLPEILLTPDTEYFLLNSLYACPHGVIEYSREIPNFVETSTNLASVKMKEDKIYITTSHIYHNKPAKFSGFGHEGYMRHGSQCILSCRR
jgi:dipeptidase D